MSSRFHNKYHRHNHHTTAITDPRYPDASHDPIASADSPFLGDFTMLGTLSAIGSSQYSTVSGQPAAVFIPGQGTNIAVQAYGDIISTGNLSVASVVLTNTTINTTYTSATASGQFLVVNINGSSLGIRLWNLP